MQVDVFHRHDLRVTAAGRATLHSEHRPECRLAQAHDGALAELIERIAETDGGRRLTLAGRRR
jgi:hypothetical protein